MRGLSAGPRKLKRALMSRWYVQRITPDDVRVSFLPNQPRTLAIGSIVVTTDEAAAFGLELLEASRIFEIIPNGTSTIEALSRHFRDRLTVRPVKGTKS